jgi:phage shock protein A
VTNSEYEACEKLRRQIQETETLINELRADTTALNARNAAEQSRLNVFLNAPPQESGPQLEDLDAKASPEKRAAVRAQVEKLVQEYFGRRR